MLLALALPSMALALPSKKVILHLERFSQLHPLLHAGIEFQDGESSCRFDFRPGPVRSTYRCHFVDEERPLTDSNKVVLWGYTEKSWDEIIAFENQNLCKRYILGVYDCRHYVRAFAEWSTGRPTPVWRLFELYGDIMI